MLLSFFLLVTCGTFICEKVIKKTFCTKFIKVSRIPLEKSVCKKEYNKSLSVNLLKGFCCILFLVSNKKVAKYSKIILL